MARDSDDISRWLRDWWERQKQERERRKRWRRCGSTSGYQHPYSAEAKLLTRQFQKAYKKQAEDIARQEAARAAQRKQDTQDKRDGLVAPDCLPVLYRKRRWQETNPDLYTGCTYSLHHSWIRDDNQVRERFIGEAVRNVYNDCPNLRSWVSGYADYTGSPASHARYETHQILGRCEQALRAKHAPLSPPSQEAIYMAALKEVSPEEKQSLLHRAIRGAIECGDDYFTSTWDTHGMHLHYWLTVEQKKALCEQIITYRKLIAYQASPQRAIDDINRIKDEALRRMDTFGESYRV